MNQIEALNDTVHLAVNHGLAGGDFRPRENPFSHLHLLDMRERVLGAKAIGQPFSASKLGRWLGWAQCSVAFSMVYGLKLQEFGDPAKALEEMKTINLRWQADPEPLPDLIEHSTQFVVDRIMKTGLGLFSDKMLTAEETTNIRTILHEAVANGLKDAAKDARVQGLLS